MSEFEIKAYNNTTNNYSKEQAQKLHNEMEAKGFNKIAYNDVSIFGTDDNCNLTAGTTEDAFTKRAVQAGFSEEMASIAWDILNVNASGDSAAVIDENEYQYLMKAYGSDRFGKEDEKSFKSITMTSLYNHIASPRENEVYGAQEVSNTDADNSTPSVDNTQSSNPITPPTTQNPETADNTQQNTETLSELFAKNPNIRQENGQYYIETTKWDVNNKEGFDCISRIIYNTYNVSWASEKGQKILEQLKAANPDCFINDMIYPNQRINLIDATEILGLSTQAQKQEQVQEKKESISAAYQTAVNVIDNRDTGSEIGALQSTVEDSEKNTITRTVALNDGKMVTITSPLDIDSAQDKNTYCRVYDSKESLDSNKEIGNITIDENGNKNLTLESGESFTNNDINNDKDQTDPEEQKNTIDDNCQMALDIVNGKTTDQGKVIQAVEDTESNTITKIVELNNGNYAKIITPLDKNEKGDKNTYCHIANSKENMEAQLYIGSVVIEPSGEKTTVVAENSDPKDENSNDIEAEGKKPLINESGALKDLEGNDSQEIPDSIDLASGNYNEIAEEKIFIKTGSLKDGTITGSYVDAELYDYGDSIIAADENGKVLGIFSDTKSIDEQGNEYTTTKIVDKEGNTISNTTYTSKDRQVVYNINGKKVQETTPDKVIHYYNPETGEEINPQQEEDKVQDNEDKVEENKPETEQPKEDAPQTQETNKYESIAQRYKKDRKEIDSAIKSFKDLNIIINGCARKDSVSDFKQKEDDNGNIAYSAVLNDGVKIQITTDKKRNIINGAIFNENGTPMIILDKIKLNEDKTNKKDANKLMIKFIGLNNEPTKSVTLQGNTLNSGKIYHIDWDLDNDGKTDGENDAHAYSSTWGDMYLDLNNDKKANNWVAGNNTTFDSDNPKDIDLDEWAKKSSF